MRTTEIGHYLELKLAMRTQEAQTQLDSLTSEEQSQATTLLANYIYHNKPFPTGYTEAVATFSETDGLETLLGLLDHRNNLSCVIGCVIDISRDDDLLCIRRRLGVATLVKPFVGYLHDLRLGVHVQDG